MDKLPSLDSVEQRVLKYLLARYHNGDFTVDYANLMSDNDLTHPQCEAIIALFYELGILSQHHRHPLHVIEKRIILLAREFAAPADLGQFATGDCDLRREFMEKAIQEARHSIAEDGRTHPKVGVVVVKNGQILAAAYRGEIAKGEHAEFTVLERKLAEIGVAGATVYTTLEPCTTRNHPKIPCVERLIERKVKRVVIGMLDPNPDICGRGYQRLRKANIAVVLFDDELKSEIEEMNRHFARQHDSKPTEQTDASPSDSLTATKQGWTFFVGQWRVGHGTGTPGLFIMSLDHERNATKSNVPDANGTWEYVHGEARITWTDGWKDILRCTPEGVLKLAFRPGIPFGATPTNVSLALAMM